MLTTGSRAQVMHGTAKHTSGGLVKSDLKMNKAGAIVSKKQSSRAKRTESPLLAVWRDSVKAVYKKPKYAGKFVKIVKGGAFYNEIKKEYVARLDKAGSCSKKKVAKKSASKKTAPKKCVKKCVKKCTK